MSNKTEKLRKELYGFKKHMVEYFGIEILETHIDDYLRNTERAGNDSNHGELFDACEALFKAPHYEHFAVRLNDEEMKALDKIKAIVKPYK